MKIQSPRTQTIRRAFTLIEVMFAVTAFAIAMFSILALVSNSLADARRLQRPMVDAGVVASWLSQTNLVEGTYHVNLGDLLGDTYNGYNCTYDIEEVQTNKLFQVDFVIQSNSGDKPVVSKMSILLFSPNSQAGSLDGATVAGR
jgi:prepilin-type N-terminal cleavage/methylation domain-containing protein